MYQTLTTVLNDRRFHELLLRLDRDLATPVRAAGCPTCSAVLHSAAYERKPTRGASNAGAGASSASELLLCEGRLPSTRYAAVAAFSGAQGVSGWARRADLGDALWGDTGADRPTSGTDRCQPRTVLRWRRWWCEVFTHSVFWRAAMAAFMPPVDGATLPASILERFCGNAQEQLIALLRFLSPITTGAAAVRAL